MEKVICSCGKEIEDVEAIWVKVKSVPKTCQTCRRTHGTKRIKLDQKIELLEKYEGVDCSILKNTPTHEGNKESKYLIWEFGGRQYGNNWAGARFDNKYINMVEKNINFDQPCNVRKMKKTVITDGIQKEYIYLIIEKNYDRVFNSKLEILESYYKNTIKGYGRDRDYREALDSDYIEIMSCSTSASSGRYGNMFKICITDPDAIKTSNGVI